MFSPENPPILFQETNIERCHFPLWKAHSPERLCGEIGKLCLR